MQTQVALIGNPNCGKTTLFNALTGARQRVGNWSGVTVEKKTGTCTVNHKSIEIVDLPGVYNLSLLADEDSEDERIATRYIRDGEADLIVNVVDASHLERNLYLTMQLIEMQVPLVLAVSMLDVAAKKGLSIDLKALSKRLGCPVIGINAHARQGIKQLKQAFAARQFVKSEWLPYQDKIEHCINKVMINTAMVERFFALRALEGDDAVIAEMPSSAQTIIRASARELSQEMNQDCDIVFATERYRIIQSIVAQVQSKKRKRMPLRAKLDKIVLNRVLGIPIFLAVMYCMFLFAINIGGALQDFFDIASQTIFVDMVAHYLNSWGAPAWFTAVIASGAGKGINTTISFIPVIGAMFLFLSFLEGSGYMARAAYIMDRFMRSIGLPGKAFVPLIVGFGCNVPAIMATRTLHHKRDRVLAIMMSPFMSCGARLAIFAVFTSAFFPGGGQNVVFALYLIGIVIAVLTGLLLRKTLLKGDPTPMILELPPYHMPTGQTLLLHTWSRLKSFIWRAGKLIVPLCILIGALNAVTIDGHFSQDDANHKSVLSMVGKTLTPVFSPMGISQDNWPATVGLATGVMAKEVVVASLNSLYSEELPAKAKPFSLKQGLTDALASIWINIKNLRHAITDPVYASAKIQELDKSAYGQMYQRFDGKVGAFAYLLFILLYFPCVSATAAITRELSRGWALFSVGYTTGLAYIVAVCFYQLATIARHPFASIFWFITCVSVFLLLIKYLQTFSHSKMWEESGYQGGGCQKQSCGGCAQAPLK